MRVNLEDILLGNGTLEADPRLTSYVHADGSIVDATHPDLEAAYAAYQEHVVSRARKLRSRAQRAVDNHRARYGPTADWRVREALSDVTLRLRPGDAPRLLMPAVHLTPSDKKAIEKVIMAYERFLSEPEYWVPTEFLLPRESISDEPLEKLLRQDTYKTDPVSGQAMTGYAKVKTRQGDQSNRSMTKLYVPERGLITIKHIQYGLRDEQDQDKQDIVATVQRDGTLSDVRHLETFTPVAYRIMRQAKPVGETVLDHNLRELQDEGYQGHEMKTDMRTGRAWTQAPLKNGAFHIERNDFEANLNKHRLLQNPVLLGGTTFEQSVGFVKDNYDTILELARSYD